MIEHLVFDRVDVYITSIETTGSSAGRQAEREAVSRLAAEAFGRGAAIDHAPSGAPVSPCPGKWVSVSHSRHWAALAVSAEAPVGIDIEEPRPHQLRRVASRVLSQAELEHFGLSDTGLLQAWTLKEALYKAAGRVGVDFKVDIVLPASGEPATVCRCPFEVVHSRFDPSRGLMLSVVRR